MSIAPPLIDNKKLYPGRCQVGSPSHRMCSDVTLRRIDVVVNGGFDVCELRRSRACNNILNACVFVVVLFSMMWIGDTVRYLRSTIDQTVTV